MTYRLQGVPGRVDEEQTAVNTGVGDMSVSKGSQLLSEVCRVLVLDLVDSASHSFLSASAALTYFTIGSQQFSLLIMSPYPGVSIMFSLSLTPFSTMTAGQLLRPAGLKGCR